MISQIGPLLFGLAVVVIALLIKKRQRQIIRDGQQAEGIIFDSEQAQQSVYPIVRFTTKNNEWITQQSNVSFIPGFYKKGKTVKVLYLENNPNQFMIDDKISRVVPIILMLGGGIFIFVGLINVLRAGNYISF